MADNIEDFESVALPPPKQTTVSTKNPFIKIDATSRSTWTLVDFSTGKNQQVKNLEDRSKINDFSWDIGFQRTKIVTNGGSTNPNGIVGLKNLGPINFDSLTDIPTTGYIYDAQSYGKIINKAIADWYIYRTRTHNIESQKNVYAVRMAEGGYLKMRILNYYCSRDESECKTIMCSRQEAACYGIEYVVSESNTQFKVPASTRSALTQLEYNN